VRRLDSRQVLDIHDRRYENSIDIRTILLSNAIHQDYDNKELYPSGRIVGGYCNWHCK